MNKKLVILLTIGAAVLIPLIWIYLQYGGFNNIPHHDITMWTFMLNYLLLFAVASYIIITIFPKDFDKFKFSTHKPTTKEKTKTQSTKKSSNKKQKAKLKTKDEEKEKELDEWRKLYKEAKKVK